MTERPLKEHYEVDSDAGIMVRTFDFIADLEKYCNSLEADYLKKIDQLSSKSQECEELKKQVSEMSDLSKDDAGTKWYDLGYAHGTVDVLNEEILADNTTLRAELEKWRTESITVRAENERLKEVVRNQDWTVINRINEAQTLRDQVKTFSAALGASQDREIELRKRCEDLEAALGESKSALEWHFDKSTPASPSDHSDFFNITANAIEQCQKLLSQ